MMEVALEASWNEGQDIAQSSMEICQTWLACFEKDLSKTVSPYPHSMPISEVVHKSCCLKGLKTPITLDFIKILGIHLCCKKTTTMFPRMVAHSWNGCSCSMSECYMKDRDRQDFQDS